MPFPNFHANRLKSPSLFDKDSFRTTRGGTLFGGNLKVPNTINLIWGKLRGRTAADDPVLLQSVRFRKSRWTVNTAKAWIQKNLGGQGFFEPAANLSDDEPALTDKQLEQAVVIGDLAEFNAGEPTSLEDIETIQYNIEFDESEEIAEIALLGAQLHQLAVETQEGVATDETSAASEKLAEDDSDEPETQDLKDIEIFQAGKWKDVVYNLDDLDEIAANFIKLRESIKPPVKLGHNKEQELLKKDGWPAAGWIMKLKRVGDKLVADINDVPRKIARIINNRGYARISSEIYTNLQDSQGTKHGKVLKAIAFLGGDIPHLKNLDDIVAQYDASLLDNEYRSVIFMADDPKKDVTKEETKTEEKEEEVTDETIDDTEEKKEDEKKSVDDKKEDEEEEEEAKTKEEVKDETKTDDTTKLSDDTVTKLAAQDELIAEMKAEAKIRGQVVEAMQKEMQAQKSEKEHMADEQFLSGLTEEGAFPPAMKNRALALMSELRKSDQVELKYTEEDSETPITTSPLELFQDMLSEWPKGMSFKETAGGADVTHPKSTDGSVVSKEGYPVEGGDLVKKIKTYMDENEGVEFEEAYIAVSHATS